MIDGEPGTRRRLRLAFKRTGRHLSFGFRRRLGHEIVPIDVCPIARPSITSLLDPLRRCLAALDMTRTAGEVSITSGETGLDVAIETSLDPSLADREALALFAETEDLARLTWRPDAEAPHEPIAARREVMVDMGGVPVSIPPGAFLQATSEAEASIRAAITEIVGEADRVADLFSGLGAFALPLALKGKTVHAVENQAGMVQALQAAARAAKLDSRVSTAIRDLDKDPLAPSDLRAFDALILDPPRAGARPQVQTIADARSTPALAMVSCNPATFARDARLLIDAGYRLKWVQPIDAFLFTAEIELVAAFTLANAS
jgi:23S rRNA (uracil1939-C5)-methyltransferase